jgi:hypothetical protein
MIAFLAISSLKAQSLKSLEDNNGFKKYKLASKFVLGLGIKHKDAEGADKIVIDYANETIGDIPVKTIELYYLKDTLAKIIVKVPPEFYVKLNEALRNSFGQPTQDFSKNEKVNFDTAFSANYYKDDFLWKATRIRLEYLYTYPKASGGAYGAKNLQLVYTLNDYGQRLSRAQKGVSSAKNF